MTCKCASPWQTHTLYIDTKRRHLCDDCLCAAVTDCVPEQHRFNVWTMICDQPGPVTVLGQFPLQALWHWPLDVAGNMEQMPNAVLVPRHADSALVKHATSVADIKGELDHGRCVTMTPTLPRAEFRRAIRTAMIEDYTGHRPDWTDRVLDVVLWHHPEEPLLTLPYHPTQTVVQREEALLPALIATTCGFPLELAKMVYAYRRRLYNVTTTLAAVDAAIKAAQNASKAAMKALVDVFAAKAAVKTMDDAIAEEARQDMHAAHTAVFRGQLSALNAALVHMSSAKRQRVA